MITAAAILGSVKRHVRFLQQLVGIDPVHRCHRNADRSADVDAMTIDFERIFQRSGEPLRKPLGVLVALCADLQHDELVAAEARDHVAGAMTVLSREATSLSNLSPIGWPSVSLMVLNRSRSIRWMAM